MTDDSKITWGDIYAPRWQLDEMRERYEHANLRIVELMGQVSDLRAELERRNAIGGELIVARRERDALRTSDDMYYIRQRNEAWAERDALRALLKAWSHFTDETIDAALREGGK